MQMYSLPSKQLAGLEESRLDEVLVGKLWEIFLAICKHWQNVADPETMKTRFLGFLSNRIELHPEYLSHYRTAVEEIDRLAAGSDRERAHLTLLTDPGLAKGAPDTGLKIARQKVSNEFISLQLSLGGFKSFVNAINYPGYISGWNGDGPAPYRTYEDKA